MNRSSLDTNVILRLVLNDVPELSAKAARYIRQSNCYVTDVVVAECVFVLERVYRLERKLIKNTMSTLFELDTVSFNEAQVEATFELYLSLRTLSFADCYSVVEAGSSGSELATFDKVIVRKCSTTAKEPV